jgi:hypothetical protein
MKKLEKAAAMLLSAAVVVIGSTGLTSLSGEQPALCRQYIASEQTVVRRADFAADARNTGEYGREKKDCDDERTTGPEAPVKPVSRREFIYLLTGSDNGIENGGSFLTREEAAYILFTVLVGNGYVKSNEAGDLSVFPDGIDTSPQYAQAVSELYALSVLQPSGSLLKPKDLISRLEAIDMIMRAKKNGESFGNRSRLCELLEIAVFDVALLENMLGCVIGAMLDEQLYGLSGEPDIRFSSLALYNAVCLGIVPGSLCELKSDSAVVITQAGMREIYSGMFAEGSFTDFDPVAADGKVTVLGESIVFMPEKKQDITVSAGTAVREPDGSVTVCCMVYVLREYFCTAKVALVKTGGWAGGHSVKSVALSMG